MSDDVEQIESRLCAYVDGELTAAEAAEIERLLDANPAHKALIRDLIAQRQMLRSLPREPAGLDLSEALQAPLEREALLAPDFADSGGRFRRGHWPQVVSLAAVFMLSVALFGAIYFVLPERHPIATVNTSPKLDGFRYMDRAGADSDEGPMAMAARRPADQTSRASGQLPFASAAETQQRTAGELDSPPPSSVVAAADAEPAPARRTVVVSVLAEAPTAANAEVIRYLTRNGVAWYWADGGAKPRVAAQEAKDATHPAQRPEPFSFGLELEPASRPGDPVAEAMELAQALSQRSNKLELTDDFFEDVLYRRGEPVMGGPVALGTGRDEESARRARRTGEEVAATAAPAEPARSVGAAPETLPPQEAQARVGTGWQTGALMRQAAGAAPASAGPLGGPAADAQKRHMEVATALEARGVAREDRPAVTAAELEASPLLKAAAAPQELWAQQLAALGGEHLIVGRNLSLQQISDLTQMLARPAQRQFAAVSGEVAWRDQEIVVAALEAMTRASTASLQPVRLLPPDAGVAQREPSDGDAGRLMSMAAPTQMLPPATRPASGAAYGGGPVDLAEHAAGRGGGRGAADGPVTSQGPAASGRAQVTAEFGDRRNELFDCVIVVRNLAEDTGNFFATGAAGRMAPDADRAQRLEEAPAKSDSVDQRR